MDEQENEPKEPEQTQPLLDDMVDDEDADEFGAVVPPYPEELYGEDDL